uniref:phenylalanine--tRNA ligase n=1 Tax=Polysiphonia sp. TaxID=1967842 RepID=A0A1Z1M3R6_9FLOR|nr:Phenylalanine-tRNA ligase beta subunit [Polysiphonia sp.]
MKFSWKLINNFIDLQKMTFNEFQEHLTLSGLEIENIEKSSHNNDKIIDLSITTNRREISSVLSLAREASIIFNTPLKILPIKLNYVNSIKYHKKDSLNSTSTHISYIRIVILQKIYDKKIPQWLLSQLKLNQREKTETLHAIQEYMKIKWGQTFSIIDINEIKQRKTLVEYSNLSTKFSIQEIIKIINNIIFSKSTNNINESKFLIFATTQEKNNIETATYEFSEFYENLYIDSIKLINTLLRIRIGKYYHAHKKTTVKQNLIKVRKEKIDQSLGYIQKKELKFIKKKKTNQILQQLKLNPKYNKTEQSFTIKVPNYRRHDLTREIDIIEEIGRIYQFQHFFNTIKKNELKGFKSQNFIDIKRIRNNLRSLGLHEVINCCLTKNIYNNIKRVKICNPITQEQQELRINILENLIHNYIHNVKHSKNNIEIFEIGKIFEINKQKHTEKRHIGGLVHNTTYTKKNWGDKFHEMNLFHFKSLMETFLERTNSTAILKEILNNDDKEKINNIEHLFNKNKKIGIYNKKSKKMIGIIGELNNKIINKSNNNNITTYIFEINLNELLKTSKSKNHLNYINKKYSNYPSVTRDISIKLNKYITIEKIKNILQKDNNLLIESIDVFNEYRKNDVRYVGLRITYRSYIKTLSNEDIKFIDTELEHKLRTLYEIAI